MGGEEYATDNGAHGVATLLCSHVTVRGSSVDFRYPAKGGIEFTTTVEDAALARKSYVDPKSCGCSTRAR